MTQQALTTGALALACAAALWGAPKVQIADPLADLPFGRVEAPSEDARLLRTFEARGWAADDQGIEEVRVFVDRRYVTSVEREAAPRHLVEEHPGTSVTGWSGKVTVPPDLPPGEHLLVVQVVDREGLARVIGVVPIVID